MALGHERGRPGSNERVENEIVRRDIELLEQPLNQSVGVSEDEPIPVVDANVSETLNVGLVFQLGILSTAVCIHDPLNGLASLLCKVSVL